jgi:hypothetical protein
MLNMRAAIVLLIFADGANAAGFRAIVSPFMTQADAKASCIAQGGSLAKLSDDNIETVSNLFAGFGDDEGWGNGGSIPVDGRGAWVGAEDRVTEGAFVWQDGSSASDAPWFPGEPNQIGNEDCVATAKWWSGSWELYDISCESMLRFVCQIDSLGANEIATVASKEATDASPVDPPPDGTCDDSKCASSIGNDCCASKNEADETRACNDGYSVVMTEESCYLDLGWMFKCCTGANFTEEDGDEETSPPPGGMDEDAPTCVSDDSKCASSIGDDCCAAKNEADEIRACKDGYTVQMTGESCFYDLGWTFKCCKA